VLYSFFAQIFNLDYTPKQVATSEYWLFVLLFCIFAYVIIKIHENWQGAKSEEQHKREQRQEFGGVAVFVIEGVGELKRRVKRLPPPEIYNPDDTSDLGCVLEGSKETLVWHKQAVELMMLSSKSYFFDKDDGWHDQEKCWIGRNKKTGEMVVFGCWHNTHSDEELQNLVKYARLTAKRQKNQRFQIIVAIKSGDTIETRKINGVAVEFENEAHLLDKLVDFEDYSADIKDKVEKTPLTDSVALLIMKQEKNMLL